MSQVQLAKATGITQATLSDIETGKTKQPSWDTLAAIGKALGETPDYLATGRRPAIGQPHNPGLAECTDVYNRLTPHNRTLWLEVGKSLVHPQQAQTSPAPAEPDRITREVSKNLRELIEKYGPGEIARTLANLEAATGSPRRRTKA
jgi:transcriptional regulator with XRE-family HTH domain